MRNKAIYIVVIGLLLSIYVLVQINKPKPIDWSLNFSRDQKIPYGCYILYNSLPKAKNNLQILINQKNLFDSSFSNYKKNTSLLIITQNFEPGKEEIEALYKFLNNGNNVFISSVNFGDRIADTLGIKTDFYLGLLYKKGATKLFLTNPALESAKGYSFKGVYASHFSRFDTLHSTILGQDSAKNVNFLKIKINNGNVFLHTIPQVFTNYHLLYSNSDYAFKALSYIENNYYTWDEFYKPNRVSYESPSPMRFILTKESLKYAYFTLLITLILFLFFEGKRRQRVIPIYDKPQNASLEFVETVGRLYFSQRDNKDLAEKKIIHFYDFIYSNYYLKANENDEKFRKQFAEKLNISTSKINKVFNAIQDIRSKTRITDEYLMNFVSLLNEIQYTTPITNKNN